LFSEALIKSLNESVSLRALIKKKLLSNSIMKQTFYIYKLKRIINEGTVRDLIASHVTGGAAKLEEIVKSNPTLTIYVPELPESSFSAKSWNVEDVPSVAIRLNNTNDVPLIWNSGEKVIPAEYTPGFRF
jgi:hypothetical protein